MKAENDDVARVDAADLQAFMHDVLRRCDVDTPSAEAVSRALLTASSMGVDSHGLRLLPHYVNAVRGGRITARPSMRFTQPLPAIGYLDADDGFGHLAGYTAMDHACSMADEVGMGAVAVGHSSHFGAAGCYALAAAERGLIGMTVCNSDPFVRLHDGKAPFHGTNPIAFSAPVEGQPPYLLDMASSSIPWNRVQQYGAIGRALPPDVAADATGKVTCDPAEVASLLPLGGADFGFKGAGLAGMVEVLSSTLTGMQNGFRLLPMGGPDMSTPRGVGHFFLAMRPDAFSDRETYQASMRTYLDDLRSQPALDGTEVMAPGDREWRCQARRDAQGIPLDAANLAAYERLAEELGLTPLAVRRS
ncbi:Ldh family oxidoreductase [Aidingimonas halophila]|uniref:Malate/lactate/ureidoglycolate dehydrogenase, LDH2 family n=1 Tax=Aidingimonas halophila TaxID=574349 RepID=A0A1H3GX66_9GAMM|nr:Ldh family oxidoreductase [Aidingimonas halophila]GHC36035.1 malate dehydrogenase [Aidingimonas halophila]SDY06949.1 Malate/lactate/ureidoglycolate dehydrogenase, LDH2 family [Aidingimonas halophila]